MAKKEPCMRLLPAIGIMNLMPTMRTTTMMTPPQRRRIRAVIITMNW